MINKRSSVQSDVEKELLFILNKEVSFRRIAGNTMILYFDGIPGDENIVTLRIDPCWRYSEDDKWMLGSDDIPWKKEENENDDMFSLRFDQICGLCRHLSYSIVERIDLAHDSSDLKIDFSGNQKIVSFADYIYDENWVFTNRKKGICIYGSVNGYEIENT